MEDNILNLLSHDTSSSVVKHKENAMHSRKQYPLSKQSKKEGKKMSIARN